MDGLALILTNPLVMKLCPSKTLDPLQGVVSSHIPRPQHPLTSLLIRNHPHKKLPRLLPQPTLQCPVQPIPRLQHKRQRINLRRILEPEIREPAIRAILGDPAVETGIRIMQDHWSGEGPVFATVACESVDTPGLDARLDADGGFPVSVGHEVESAAVDFE